MRVYISFYSKKCLGLILRVSDYEYFICLQIFDNYVLDIFESSNSEVVVGIYQGIDVVLVCSVPSFFQNRWLFIISCI